MRVCASAPNVRMIASMHVPVHAVPMHVFTYAVPVYVDVVVARAFVNMHMMDLTRLGVAMSMMRHRHAAAQYDDCQCRQ